MELPRPVGFMHEEALVTLPQVLDAFAIRAAILVGHSDGGSISIIHAGGTRDPRVRGLILEAPHVFVEEVGGKYSSDCGRVSRGRRRQEACAPPPGCRRSISLEGAFGALPRRQCR